MSRIRFAQIGMHDRKLFAQMWIPLPHVRAKKLPLGHLSIHQAPRWGAVFMPRHAGGAIVLNCQAFIRKGAGLRIRSL
jgi:hypothetical protein